MTSKIQHTYDASTTENVIAALGSTLEQAKEAGAPVPETMISKVKGETTVHKAIGYVYDELDLTVFSFSEKRSLFNQPCFTLEW
jgi:hypothetical protein